MLWELGKGANIEKYNNNNSNIKNKITNLSLW